MRKQILLIATILVIITGCNSNQGTKDTTAENAPVTTEAAIDTPAETTPTPEVGMVDTPAPSPTPPVPDTLKPPKKETIPGPETMVITFISIGEGTDYQTQEKFDKLLNEWKSRTSDRLIVERVGWGREGESDYCLDFQNLKGTEASDLAKEIRSMMQGKNLVQFQQNQPCPKRR